MKKSISFRKASPYQVIRLLNAKIIFDGEMNKNTDYYKEERDINRMYKRNIVETNKLIKKSRARLKEGFKSKGWETRTKNKINKLKADVLHYRDLSSESLREINNITPPILGYDKWGKPISTYNFDEHDTTIEDYQMKLKAIELQKVIAGRSLYEIQSSERLYRYISGEVINSFGSWNKFMQFSLKNGII